MDSGVRDLGLRLQDLVRSVRLLRQRRADERPAVPVGLVGILLQIDRLATGCHARELAARTRLDPSTVSRAVAALVSHGLVERRPDPTDKRASFLAVTPAGRAALADTYGWYGEVLDKALACWAPGEVAAFAAALDRFTHDIEVALATPETLTLANNDNLEAAR
ncbi:MarR family winged helix-turn-helix transcriptional regulator [Micromonospora krabiensis]|uniref:DNA-binding transcriptional regulator, MarR family n=1 Tax=Micromonospora krabiensis TaxID=307121 RepID=A0A1C3N2Z7_9ACTN|nr:MarR family transcriptional regulator [Micromonospora krabiensis]SBV26947.1 DNA-binding transcriptional regulator, MarR family [Micromonospora krabiensis]